ncbi:hypothetical protein JCM3765_005036 [Sporobolomyces pararoseus]
MRRCYWIRAPALMPSIEECRVLLQSGGRDIEPLPALPALFDPSTTSINLAGDSWIYEKLGFECDQSFWHLYLNEQEGVVIKVAFDQSFGMKGRRR